MAQSEATKKSSTAKQSSANNVKKEAAKKPAATKAAKPIANKLASKATSTTKTSAAARRQAMIDFDDNYDGEVAMRVDNDNTSPFLRLPPEIRTTIYSYAAVIHNARRCPDLRISAGWGYKSDKPRAEVHKHTLHNLLRVNRQVWLEVINYMHKHVGVWVDLNTPCTTSEFGSGDGGLYNTFEGDPFGEDDDDSGSDLSDAFIDDEEDDMMAGYGFGLGGRASVGPVKRELKKWRRIDLHGYRGGGDYVASIADDLQGFLKWFSTWNMPAGGLLVIHVGSFFMANPEFGCWDYRCIKEVNTWLKKQDAEKLKQVQLSYCRPLRERIRTEDPEMRGYRKLAKFLRNHEQLVICQEQC